MDSGSAQRAGPRMKRCSKQDDYFGQKQTNKQTKNKKQKTHLLLAAYSAGSAGFHIIYPTHADATCLFKSLVDSEARAATDHP